MRSPTSPLVKCVPPWASISPSTTPLHHPCSPASFLDNQSHSLPIIVSVCSKHSQCVVDTCRFVRRLVVALSTTTTNGPRRTNGGRRMEGRRTTTKTNDEGELWMTAANFGRRRRPHFGQRRRRRHKVLLATTVITEPRRVVVVLDFTSALTEKVFGRRRCVVAFVHRSFVRSFVRLFVLTLRRSVSPLVAQLLFILHLTSIYYALTPPSLTD